MSSLNYGECMYKACCWPFSNLINSPEHNNIMIVFISVHFIKCRLYKALFLFQMDSFLSGFGMSAGDKSSSSSASVQPTQPTTSQPAKVWINYLIFIVLCTGSSSAIVNSGCWTQDLGSQPSVHIIIMLVLGCPESGLSMKWTE